MFKDMFQQQNKEIIFKAKIKGYCLSIRLKDETYYYVLGLKMF